MNYRHFCVIFLLLIVTLPANAQDNKELARQLVEIGDEILNSTFAYSQARDQFVAAVNADPENIRANYMAGKMYLEDVNKGRAKDYFLKAYELDPKYAFDLLFDIGLGYHYDFEFDQAIGYYEQYLAQLDSQPNYNGDDRINRTFVERKIYECGVGKELVAHPIKVSIVNLGSSVNSEYDDYAPVLNKDETLLIFTSRRREQNMSQDVHTDNIPFEDIYFSVKNDSVWNYSSNIGNHVNTTSHDSNLGLSKDGSQLFIYNSDVNNGDIFVSHNDGQGNWTDPIRLPEPINSNYNENGVSLTEDGNWMFFSSDRPGGNGNHDIYMSKYKGRGRWKHPVNLGPIINSAANEEGPFIGYDGKTLYFSSNGGRGMGRFDIYKSVYDSTSRSWGIPVNLGFPINTPDQDVHFSTTKEGYRAYYATTRDDGFGNTDIYMITFKDEKEEIFQIPEPAPEPELIPVTIRVQVVDADSGGPISNEVKLMEIGTGMLIPGSLTGNIWVFTITSEGQKEYFLSIEKKGFGYYNIKMTFPGASVDTVTLERTIRLKKLEVGYTKVLRNVYFDFDKAILKDESFNEMDKLKKMLTENPKIVIRLNGHTDNIGTEAYNIDLSGKRALAIKNFLVEKGVDARHIETSGLGSEFPLVSNDDELDGREINRRVEMVIISN